jgi:4'-phosphopantetheinyl transferase
VKPIRLSSHAETQYVDLWLADLDVHLADVDRFDELLSDSEREKRLSIKLERIRKHAILSRGILRSVLALYLACDAKDIVIETEPLGKPLLGQRHIVDSGGAVHFNVSHSDGLLAIALSACGPVGVDIEKIRSIDEMDSIASELFSDDQRDALHALSGTQRLDLFFQYWVHREAVTKAMGVGLLEQVEIQYPSQNPGVSHTGNVFANELYTKLCVSKRSESLMEWRLLEFSPRSGYIGCVAVTGSNHLMRTNWFLPRR